MLVFAAKTCLVEDLRSQVAEKTARIASVESELSRATSTFTETLKSMNAQLGADRRTHFEEKAKLERRITTLEHDLADANLQKQTLYTEIEKLKIERAEIHTQLNIHLESQSKMKKEIAVLEGRLRLEEEAKRTFETSFKQAADEVKSLKHSNELLKTEVDQREESESRLRKESEQNQKALADSQQNLKTLEDQHRKLKKTYIANCTQFEEVKGEGDLI